MLQELLDDITRYFDYLQSEGFYVSFHNFMIPMDQCMVRLTPYNINRNPFCLLVKAVPDAWTHCIERQMGVLEACSSKAFCGMCYAGMSEYVVPVSSLDGSPVAFLSVSGFCQKEEQAMERIRAVSRKYGHSEERLVQSFYHDLKPLPENPDNLLSQIAPLGRMFELLHLHLSSIQGEEKSDPVQDNTLSHAVMYLRRHYTEPISAEEVACICNCSVSTLSHLFKKKMGVGIRDYLKELRISDAKHLLQDTELSISTLSDLLGYGNPNYFCNVFRRETGLAPTRFREQCRLSASADGSRQ